MTVNKIVFMETMIYIILYVLIYFFVTHMKLSTGGDAAGNGMERGLTILLILAAFFVIAVTLMVVNLFLFKGITGHGMKFLAFVPLLVSVAHILYFIKFG